MTVSTVRSLRRALEVRSRNSDSGVVMRMSADSTVEPRALLRRRVAGTNGQLGHRDGHAQGGGGVGDAGERRAEVPLDVDGQRLERGDVEDTAAGDRGPAAGRTSAG